MNGNYNIVFMFVIKAYSSLQKSIGVLLQNKIEKTFKDTKKFSFK
jgi:hypothetical protein